MKYKPGRSQAEDYRLDRNWPDISIPIDGNLLVIGGLYGNRLALDALLDKTDEQDTLVFNGDFHWFDYQPEDFLYIQENVLEHYAMCGNVEKELLRNEDVGLGCGCAYPEDVNDIVVDRSNAIHQKLKSRTSQSMDKKMNQLPDTLTFEMGDFRIGVTHGDEKSLAGWECSLANLKEIQRQKEITTWMQEQDIDILASTHTCGTAFLYSRDQQKIISNNGAAGMPNFSGTDFGLVTRIASSSSEEAVYSQSIAENNQKMYVELVPVRYEQKNYVQWFDSIWPKGTPAEKSYRNRIIKGPPATLKDAIINV